MFPEDLLFRGEDLVETARGIAVFREVNTTGVQRNDFRNDQAF